MDRIGPYFIERKVGTGGMGTVYLASHEQTHEQVAVKVLPASLAREPGFLARFDREIAALRQLDNPHVVKIFESGTVSDTGNEEDQCYYYAMEYVDGETLLSKLRRERRLPWPMVIDYGVQICSALKAAHDAGIVHRDLKPSNLLISNDGNVKLADFGVAQVFASTRLTKTGGIIGTAEFMSPEQAQGQRSTKKSDLYSLGAVLYTMLSGKPPYSGQTMLDVLHKHRFGQFDRPRHYAPDCPYWLEEIVCQLLEKEPDKRPADAYVTGKRLREVLKKVELSQSEPLPGRQGGSSFAVGPPTGQEILSHDDDSISGAAEYSADGPTRTAPGLTDPNTPAVPRGPGEATIMHSLMREEISRQHELHPVQKFFENTWVLLGLFALLILGGFVWYKSLPTPEWHLAEARRLIDEGDYSTARIEHLEPLSKEGGQWSEIAEELIATSRRLEKDPTPRTRRQIANSTADPGPLAAVKSESDRILLRAAAERDRGDISEATRTLQAFLAVTEGREQLTVERRQATQLLASLPPVDDLTAERNEFIDSGLARYRVLRKEGKNEEAEKIRAALLSLYSDDAEAMQRLGEAASNQGGD